MKIFKYTAFLLLAGSLFALPSCNNDDDDDDDPGTPTPAGQGQVMLHFHPVMGNQDFVMGTTYQDNSGRNFNFSQAQFYISAPKLWANANGSQTVDLPEGYQLVKAGHMMYDMGQVPAGSYYGLSFDVGVDSATNHADPSLLDANDPLAPQNPSMHWSWTNGYIFVRLEGQFDSTATGDQAPNKDFLFHIGLDELLRSVTLNKAIDVQANQMNEVMVMVDFLEYLNGVDLLTENQTKTMNNLPLATKVADNANSAFRTGM